jgi:LPXTG-motif cell wall-anchored protein
VPAGEALPFTGINDSAWAGIGFSLLLLGGLILLSISRRQEQPIGAWVGTTWRSSRRRNTINLLGPGLQDG